MNYREQRERRHAPHSTFSISLASRLATERTRTLLMSDEPSGLRILSGIARGSPFEIDVDGQATTAYPGETLATVLIAAGLRPFRHTLLSGQPRALYCGMGICYDCLVTVNDRPNVRACMTPAQPGDRVKRQL
jgi:hypothetical protein